MGVFSRQTAMSDMSGRLRRTQVAWSFTAKIIFKSRLWSFQTPGDQPHVEVCRLGEQRPGQRRRQLLHLPRPSLLSRFSQSPSFSVNIFVWTPDYQYLTQMTTSAYLRRQNLASLAPSQACSSNPPVGQWNAWRSDIRATLLEERLRIFFFPGRCSGPWTCLPLGFWPEKARNRAALHIIAWILPSSSSPSMSTSSNHNHVCGGHDHDIRHGQDHSMSSSTSTNLDSFSCDVIQ